MNHDLTAPANQPALAGFPQANQFVDGEGYDYTQAVDTARDLWQAVQRDGLNLGVYLLALKKQEPHGRYLDALKAINIPQRTAHRLSDRAAWVLDHPANQPALANLTGEQIDTLKKLPAEAYAKVMGAQAEMVAGEPVEQAARRSTRQFRQLLNDRLGEDHFPEAPKKSKKQPDYNDVVGVFRKLPRNERTKALRLIAMNHWDADLPLYVAERGK